MTDQKYTFNWHTLDQSDDYEGFLRWMFVNLVTESRGDGTTVGVEHDHLIHRVLAASDGANDVTLTIQANGIELNVEHFVRGVQRNMRWHAHQAALDELRRRINIDQLTDTVSDLRIALTERTVALAGELGIRLNEDGDVL